MDGSARFPMVLALVAAMGGAFWSPEPPPPLTPAELAKIGSLLPALNVHTLDVPSPLVSALNVPPRVTGFVYTRNGLYRSFCLMPDGGLLLIVAGNTGMIAFRLDTHLRLVKSVLVRKSDTAILPVPDPVGGLRAEFAYWANGVDRTGTRLPNP